jgi:predicted TIM-barrel fold metal-dependent hydrolase
MSSEQSFISTDDHVLEPPDLWTARLSKSKWGDQIPHLERQTDGTEQWIIDGQTFPLVGGGSVGACLKDPSSAPQRWEDVPSVCYRPGERLNAMDTDGAAYSVLYPMVAGIAGEVFGRIKNAELEIACVRAYNDWIIEEWGSASNRFLPQCIVPLSSVAAAVEEAGRAVAKGHKGIILPAVPSHLRPELRNVNDPEYEAFWSACEELSVPLCFHAGASPRLQLQPYSGYSRAVAQAFQSYTRPFSAMNFMGNFLVSRILERHPRLKTIFADTALGWITFALESSDYAFDQTRTQEHLGYKLKPSEAFQRQCYVIGWYDKHNLQQACRFPGANNILWAMNFPFATSSWPRTSAAIDACFAGVSEGDRRRVLWANAAELYGVN